MASSKAVFWRDGVRPAVTAGGILHGDGTKYSITAAGTTGQVLTSQGASDPIWSAAPGAAPEERTVTTTGNIDDLDIGTNNVVILRMNNASDSTIRGMVPGVANQRVFIFSIGAGHVFLAHQNASSSAANRMINVATSGSTPLAAGFGVAQYVYDDTTDRWRLIEHDQGSWITPTFSAGNFTASGSMTWTVESGDVTTYAYWLKGQSLFITWYISGTTVGGTVGITLFIAVPNGFTMRQTSLQLFLYNDAGAGNTVGFCQVESPGGTTVQLYKLNLGNYTLATNTTGVFGTIVGNVT